jgi:hypothetical protein
MAEGFVQVAPDSTGKQIDNDVVATPAGNVDTDGSGNQTTLAAPAYRFRQRTINADPNNPAGLATVASTPGANDFGLTVRMPVGQADLQTIAALLLDIDANIAALAGNAQQAPALAIPVFGQLPPPQLTPTVSRPIVSDKFGRQIVVTQTVRELVDNQATTITNVATEQTIIAAGAADTFNDLIAIIAVNTSATATRVDIRDQLSSVTTPAGGAVMPIYLPAGDTRGISLGGVIIPQTNRGQLWTAQCSVAVTDVRIWALYAVNK